MKKIFVAVLILSFSINVIAYAHAGSLDEYGGHVDHKAHEYHYHHGWPAHYHSGDYCQYNWIDKTNKGYIGTITQEEYDRLNQHDYSDRDQYVPSDAHTLDEYDSLQKTQKEVQKKDASSGFKGFLAVVSLLAILNIDFIKELFSVKKDKPQQLCNKPTTVPRQITPADPVDTMYQQSEIEPNTYDKWALDSLVYCEPEIEKELYEDTQLPAYTKSEPAETKHADYWKNVPTNIVPVDPYCVYWTIKGTSFHSTDKCIALKNSKVITSGPMAYAFSEGHIRPCSKCVGENYTIK